MYLIQIYISLPAYLFSYSASFTRDLEAAVSSPTFMNKPSEQQCTRKHALGHAPNFYKAKDGRPNYSRAY